MDNLRIILIILGIIIVAAIYLWERYQNKHDLEIYRTSPPEDDDEQRLIIRTTTRFDEDISSELADLKNFMGESSRSMTDEEKNAILPGVLHDDLEKNDSISGSPDVDRTYADINTVSADDQGDSPHADSHSHAQKESIVMLHIIAPEDNWINGDELVAVADQLGFEFGEMDIFHYHENSDAGRRRSLFSLVNMYEPGCFDLENMRNFKTRGISVFARLDNDGTATDLFDSMLAVTRHAASLLGCSVSGPDRTPLTTEMVNRIKKELVDSEM